MFHLKKTALLVSLAMLIFSCNQNQPLSNIPQIDSKTSTSKVISISGKVEFPISLNNNQYFPVILNPSPFTTQATISELGTYATVSLIYPADYPTPNRTIATGLTDANGTFLINPSSAFQPVTGDIFVLEASRRIGSSGNDVMTLRTLIKWMGNEWKSITYPGIMINAKTTALSIISDYNQNVLKSNDIINKLQIISTQVQLTDITSSTGFLVTQENISNTENLVIKALANNLDPVFEINCESLLCKLKNDVIPGEFIVKRHQFTSDYNWSLFLADQNLEITTIGNISDRLYLVRLKNGNSNIYEYDKLFEFREGNILMSTNPITDPTQLPAVVSDPDKPNDPGFGNQYSLIKTDALRGWGIAQGFGDVILAVIDTGVDYSHEDFGCTGVTPSTADNELPFGCRMIAPSKWRNTFENNNNPMDHSGHGTHIAGIISAVGNNGKGIAGITNSEKIKIMPVKVGNNQLSLSSAAIASGILWAANNGADIINLSLGGSPSKVIEEAINYAITQKGIYVVAAAGNNCSKDGIGNDRLKSCSAFDYPAGYRGVTAVGATDRDDNLWNTGSNGSQYPPNIVMFTAPGDKIYSTLPGNQYGYKSGTSMSTAFVSALAAMVKSQNPGFTHDQINKQIFDNIVDLGASGKDDKFGWGRIDIYKTILKGRVEMSVPALTKIEKVGNASAWNIILGWRPSTETGISKASSYKVYRKNAGGDIFLASISATSPTTYTDTNQSDDSLEYYIKACNETIGCSNSSMTVKYNEHLNFGETKLATLNVNSSSNKTERKSYFFWGTIGENIEITQKKTSSGGIAYLRLYAPSDNTNPKWTNYPAYNDKASKINSALTETGIWRIEAGTGGNFSASYDDYPAYAGTYEVKLQRVYPVPFTMTFVQGGTFIMGDQYGGYVVNGTLYAYPEGLPTHSVTVSSFYMNRFEVTQGEYQELMGNNPSFHNGTNKPIETVSWFDAIKYCNTKSQNEGIPVAYKITGENCNIYNNPRNCSSELIDSEGNLTTDVTKVVGYRLPTEAEWEYAAKGGNRISFCESTDPGKRCRYSGSNNPDEVAWNNSNPVGIPYEIETHIVGTKSPNELGIFDMSGNVYEWVQDRYTGYTGEAVTNPYISTGESIRVHRGGSSEYSNYFVLSAFRNSKMDISREYLLGFRIVRSNP